MRYSTIQVTPRMRKRLARYKLERMSYEEVLEILLDAVPVEEFRARKSRAAAAARAALAATGRREPAVAAEEARRAEEERVRALTPGQRMEEAHGLFELFRGAE